MTRTRPVASLTGDVDLRPGGVVAILRGEVALAKVGGVTLGAHVVPVLVGPRPVKRVTVRNRFVGVEVEPLLALRVPGDTQGLQPATGEFHQVLLQRPQAEGVGDLEVLELAVGPIGVHVEPAVPVEERGGHAEVREADVVEVSQDGGLAGHLHGVAVIGARPAPVLLGVASTALFPTDVGERLRRRGRLWGGRSLSFRRAGRQQRQGEQPRSARMDLRHLARTSPCPHASVTVPAPAVMPDRFAGLPILLI